MTAGRRWVKGGGASARARRALVLLLLAAAAIGATAAIAYEPVGPDFRISTTGNDNDAARIGTNSQIAYNPTANEYLVVWDGDGLGSDDQFEIFGQRLSATGAEIGVEFRISHATDIASNRDAISPAIAYSPDTNEYLVTWTADQTADNAFEVFGRRLSASGTNLGEVQISNVTAVHAAGDADASEVAYNPTADQYLVIWSGNGTPTDGELEMFGQRVSAAGVPDAQGDFRISNIPPDMDVNRNPSSFGVAYGSTPDEYLVTWTADGLIPTDGEFEVFGQRVSAAGDELGGDFRLSTVGADGDPAVGAQATAVAYSSAANEFLVVWSGEGLGDALGEIFGQRVGAAGTELGGDFRISRATDVGANRDALTPSIAYNGTANEYLVTWVGDVLATDDEFEVFGQRLDGAAVPGSAFRISSVGTDTDIGRFVNIGTLSTAFGSVPNEYLVSWTANGLTNANEFEIFGHRLALPAPPPAGGSPSPSSSPSIPQATGLRAAALKKCKKKKKKSARARRNCRKRASKLPV